MAELNELLEDAKREAEGLAQTASSAVEATEGLITRASDLMEAVLKARSDIATHTEELRTHFAERCAALKAEAVRVGEACSLVGSHAGEARGETEAFSRGLASHVEALRVARGETQAELRQRLDEPKEALAVQTALLSGHQEALGKGSAEARAALEQLTASSETLRETLAARRELVLSQLDALETRARSDLAGTVDTLDALGAAVESRAREATDRLRALGANSAEAVRDRLDRDAEHAFEEASGQILQGLQEAQRSLETEGHQLDLARETLSQLAVRIAETDAAIIGNLR